MRKLLSSLVLTGTVLLFLGGSCKEPQPPATGPQFDRTLLVEVFTNVECPNCPVADAYVDSLVAANPRTVAVKYHSPRYPFPDPFATDQVEHRENFYFGSTNHGYPYVIFDGVYRNEGVSGIAGWNNQVAERLQVSSPVQLLLGGTYNAAARAGTLQVTVDGDTGLTARVLAVLAESNLPYQGDTFHHVFRTFVGDPAGQEATVPATLNLPFAVDPNWHPENLAFVVFFQDPGGEEVYQAGRIALSDLASSTPPEVFQVSPATLDTSGPVATTLRLRFYLKNVGSASDSAWVEVRGNQPASWIVSLCIGDMCLPRPSGYTHLLSPGDSVNLDVDLYAMDPDTATLWLFTEAQVGTDRDSARIHVTFTGK